MNSRSFVILLTLVLIMVALMYSLPRDFGAGARSLLLPGLSSHVNDIERITITGAGEERVATLRRRGRQWTIDERAGHRADVGRIRRALLALAYARVIEQETTDPALHWRLGVEDLAALDATGLKLVMTGSGETYGLIVGDRGARTGTTFARKPDAAQSFLISASLDLGHETLDWVARDIMDIGTDRIHRVTITHPDGSVLRVENPTRGSAGFTVIDLPADREPAYEGVANSMAGLLTDLAFDDVQPVATFTTGGDNPTLARFETFDGLIVDAMIYAIPEGPRVRFVAHADAALARRFEADETDTSRRSFEAASEDATRLNDALAGWVYTLPRFKSKQFVSRMEAMLEPAT